MDGSRWGERVIKRGSVIWLGRTMSLDTSREGCPQYDGRLDGLRGPFYAYGRMQTDPDAVYLHSIIGAEWPGPQCVDGVFCWNGWRAK